MRRFVSGSSGWGRSSRSSARPSRSADDRPATFWGLALVTDDLDATAAGLGAACTTPKQAVQPGRRIATLKTRDLGISVPIAFMSPPTR